MTLFAPAHESVSGTKLPIWDVRSSAAIGAKPGTPIWSRLTHLRHGRFLPASASLNWPRGEGRKPHLADLRTVVSMLLAFSRLS